MGYSNDLRVRVIQVVENGAAARAAARQFVIGDSTAIRWVKRWRETGSVEAKSIKGQSRSPLKRHEEWLLELVRREARSDTGGDPGPSARRASAQGGDRFGLAVLRPPRHQLQKKACARPSRIGLTLPRRASRGRRIKPSSIPIAWSSSTKPGPAPTWRRLRGRAPRGERLVGKIPHGHWKTTTFVAGLRSTALTAPCVIDGPMNGNAFLAYVEQILASEPQARRHRRAGQSQRP